MADPASVYSRHRLAIAPLRSGAGLKGKVIAAAGHGIPQLLSPLAAEASGLRHGQEVWIAHATDDWLQGAETLLTSDTQWQAMAEAAHAFVQRTYSWEQAQARMAEAFRRVGLPAGDAVEAQSP